jgi:hypothetical protein
LVVRVSSFSSPAGDACVAAEASLSRGAFDALTLSPFERFADAIFVVELGVLGMTGLLWFTVRRD